MTRTRNRWIVASLGCVTVGVVAARVGGGVTPPPARVRAGTATLAQVAAAPGQAASLAEASVRRNPDDPAAHHALHAAYEALGQQALLPARYAALRARRPDLPRLVLEHGRALMRAKRRDEALAVLAACTTPPHDREARRLAALLHLEAGRFARAAAELEALQPLDAGTARYLGLALALSGRASEALPLLRRAVLADPGHEPCLFLAIALRHAGELDEAARLLRSLVADPRAPAAATLELARLELGPGRDPAAALSLAEAALRRGEPCQDVLAQAYLACGELEMARITLEVADAEPTPAATRARCRELLRDPRLQGAP